MHRARILANSVAGSSVPKLSGWLVVKNSPSIVCAQCRNYNVPAAQEPFLNGSSSQYVEDMYNAWLADPASVHTVSTYQI